VSAPLRSLRKDDLVEVLRSGERRCITEIQDGTPMLYRACVLKAIPGHVRAAQERRRLVRDPGEWYVADELRLQ
jgi:hypothetical protein